jgi:pre-mRNA-processing factor 6
MQVFVRTLTGRSVVLAVSDTDTVDTVKLKLQNTQGIPVHLQRLQFAGKQLENDRALEDYSIGRDDTLHLSARLLGGMLAGKKKNFEAAPPQNYVAGLGRGATGFTTRSDIGPARSVISQAVPDKDETGRMAPKDDLPAFMNQAQKETEDFSESNFDEFSGYGGALFADAAYEQDDREADSIWESVEDKMDERRAVRREQRINEEMSKFRKERPKITQQFADLKRSLADLSADEWDAIPEVGDVSKKKKKDSYMPVPDSLLQQAQAENQQHHQVDEKQMMSGGMTTPSTPVTDLKSIGEGRGTVLSLKLDRVSDNVSGQTVVDPKGYLTDLNSLKVTSDAEIGDIKKARLLLKSVIQTNPKHPPGWIAAARLEELAGKIVQARSIIAKGCAACTTNEDVWLENARLQTPENAKKVLVQAVKNIPTSVKVWIRACDLEIEHKAKRRVLRRALELIPNSVRLWKAAIELEEPDDAKILLSRAVECVPLSVEMWLALARLETPENARKVLNQARQTLPTEPMIWITAAKLEEANDNQSRVEKIIERAVKSLSQHNQQLDRDRWLKEAKAAEEGGHYVTCGAIVRVTIGLDVDDQDRKRIFKEDFEECMEKGYIHTARSIVSHALTIFPGKKSLWRSFADLEKNHGSRESLLQVLRKATNYCPQAEVLWLMGAKELWLAGQIAEARKVLSEAFAANPDSEDIWLAAVKLEKETKEPERARALLTKARERASTERVWMRSAQLEREFKNPELERELLEKATKLFPKSWKLNLMLAQLEDRQGNIDKARLIYHHGINTSPQAIPVWLCSAQLEISQKNVAKARALLDKARLKNQQNPQLWIASIRTELQAGNKAIAMQQLAKAMQECPKSGLLWAEAIQLEPRPQRKSKSIDALKRCDNDSHVIAAVAKLFWADRKIEKARTWFNRAVTLDTDNGDIWAYFYKFEVSHGSDAQQEAVKKRCTESGCRHGEVWPQVAKMPENSGCSHEVLLRKVAAKLQDPVDGWSK